MNHIKQEEIDYDLTHCPSRLRHFFHVVSNIRPIIWIGVYVCAMPLFALFYYWIPVTDFRIPQDGGTSYWSWLYYSIVTITTLGFGDYTPAHGWAQAVTAIEVVFGLSVFGFFLNAVGAMRSENDVASAIEKQRAMHQAEEKDKLLKYIPILLHNINRFLAYCYAVTTPLDKRTSADARYNSDFRFSDMHDMYKPSGLSFDSGDSPAVDGLLKCIRDTVLFLDSLQTRIDLTLWPDLMADSFTFVANSQLFVVQDNMLLHPDKIVCDDRKTSVCDARDIVSRKIQQWSGPAQVTQDNPLSPVVELYMYLKSNAEIALRIESIVTEIARSGNEETEV